MTRNRRLATSVALSAAVLLIFATESYPEQKPIPGKPERKSECIGLGCGDSPQKCIGLGCGENRTTCIGLGCKDAQSPTPIEVRLTVSEKQLASAENRRMNIGELLLNASVTGLPSQSHPSYQFAVWGENVVLEYGDPIQTSGEFSSNTSWMWTPPQTFAGSRLKFTVAVKIPSPNGDVIQTAQAGLYHIVDDTAARLLFTNVIATVMTFPRCTNCHNGGDSPTQGDDRHLHVTFVSRQTDCTQCHGLTNGTTPGSPPGALGWRLAPAEFSFSGKTPAQLCRQIKDPALKGGRTLEELDDHVRTDPIIFWAFHQGPGRTTPTGTWEGFAFDTDAKFHRWIKLGAACPDPPQLLGPKPSSPSGRH